jgi:hypothetical protein
MAATLTIDCTAKTVTVRPLTAEEQADLDTLQTAQVTRQTQETAATTERINAGDDLRTRAAAALTRLDALSTDPTTTDTAAEVRQGLRDVAQIVHALLRHATAQTG